MMKISYLLATLALSAMVGPAAMAAGGKAAHARHLTANSKISAPKAARQKMKRQSLGHKGKKTAKSRKRNNKRGTTPGGQG